jgi:hypothetical protein
MKRINAMELHARKVAELGLDPAAVDLSSIEAIAAALRRVASFLCPCAASTLVRAVVLPLRGLVEELGATKKMVEWTLEGLIAHGDILEELEVGKVLSQGAGKLVYAAPPSFVLRQSGVAILVGTASDQISALREDLAERIEYINHLRRLSPLPGEDLRRELVQLGFIELSYNTWLRSPPIERPAKLISRLNRLLSEAPLSGDVPGLLLLDPERPVRYYRGRWVEPSTQNGKFVGRRKQAYGADVWCYIEMENGVPKRFVDFPLSSSFWRGCDEAWRLQAGIDCERGAPQMFRVRLGRPHTNVFDFFSPLPMWAVRRWDAAGEPLKSPGSLFSYKFRADEVEEEIRFLKEDLWLTQTG